MNDFGFNLDATALTAFLLVLSRTVAWIITAPVFSTVGIPQIARLGFSVSIAALLTPSLAASGHVPTTLSDFAVATFAQVIIGLVMGFLTNLVVQCVTVAGSLIDLQSGFSFGTLLDPVSGAQSATFSRMLSMTFATLVFVTGAYQSLILGFAHSFSALPLDHFPHMASGLPMLLAQSVGQMLVAAIEIGAPLLGVLLLADVAMALATRFVPQANAMSLSLPLKGLITVAASGLVLAAMPGHLDGIMTPALQLPGQVLR